MLPGSWRVEFHPEFEPEFDAWTDPVRVAALATFKALERLGPLLGRPDVDTLAGSAHANMKELRFVADGGVWRVAFAFDPRRRAILLCGASKAGVNQARFYRALIRTAERRFDAHLAALRSSPDSRR